MTAARRSLAAAALALVAGAGLLIPVAPVGAADDEVVLPPESSANCAGDVPIVVGSDAAAQSDIYSSVTLAGVVGTDCIVLAGARGEPMSSLQRGRLRDAAAGGYVVGGTAAVPEEKVAGRGMTRLDGVDRWHTARLVGVEAFELAGGTSGDVRASVGAEDSGRDCTGDVPILVGSDADALSDRYSSVTLAGVVGTDCIVLAGARGERMSLNQRLRLRDAAAGGYVVGGAAAVPDEKLDGRDMTRLAGLDRWHTARLVGDEARRLAADPPDDRDDSDVEPTLSEIVDAEAAVADMVNELRINLGLEPLTYNDNLADSARDWSESLRDGGGVRVDPKFRDGFPTGWTNSAQIVSRRSSSAALLGAVHQVFRNLEGNSRHRASLTSTGFNEFGIGVAVRGDTVWVTQNLAYYPPVEDEPGASELRIIERVMVDLVNNLREGLGLSTLTHSSDLSDVARAWSEKMRDDGIFVHNPSNTQQYPAGWSAAGENIAWRQSGGTLLDKVHAAFNGLVNSPGHYANMTSSSFNQIGVGVAVAGRNFWVTQNFAYYP